VLDGEDAEQQHVDDERREQSARFAAVDGLGRRQVADEGDGIEESAEKQQVDRSAVENRNDTSHGCLRVDIIRSTDRILRR